MVGNRVVNSGVVGVGFEGTGAAEGGGEGASLLRFCVVGDRVVVASVNEACVEGVGVVDDRGVGAMVDGVGVEGTSVLHLLSPHLLTR